MRRWDFTTAVISKTRPTGLTDLTDIDVAVKDVTTNRYAFIQVTNAMNEEHNAIQIDKIRNALASSPDPSIMPYKGNTDVFGWVNYNSNIHPKVTDGLISIDSVFIHNMKPTYVIIDSAKKVVNANKITFHTESEADNSGFLVVRCKMADTVFQVASTFITGAGNSNVRKDYTYLDYFAETGVSYKYLIYQYNTFSYMVYISDTAKIYDPNGAEEYSLKPVKYSLLPSYPNPFNPETRITFELPEASNTSLTVYDMLGKNVDELISGYYTTGQHNVTWTPKDLPSGVYLVIMRTEKFSATQKVMYLK